MKEQIYALCEVGGNPFYVGRTGRTIPIREQEHRWAALQGTEAKYQRIREIWDAGSDFESILLEEIDVTTDAHDRWEDFWVYTLSLEYDLTNMKAGDAKNLAKQDAMRSLRGKQRTFANAQEFLTAMDREIEEEQARKKARTQLLKARSKKEPDVSLTRFVGDYGINGTKEQMSSGLQAILNRRKK